jgi:TIR domain
MPEPEKIETAGIANRLAIRRSNNHRTVLVLGSRAGGLFRSQHFYDTFKLTSPHDFTQLSWIQQFVECYRLLSRKHYSEAEIHSILSTSLHHIDIGDADICMVELVQQGYFDQVISANIDDLLEHAFAMIKVKGIEVLIPRRKTFSNPGRGASIRISKMFGDLASMDYSMLERSGYLEKDVEFKKHLVQDLAEDVMIIGLDAVWDEELLYLIPANQRSLWLINEDSIIEHPLVSRLSNTRQIFYVEGGEGSYERFAKVLHWYLFQAIRTRQNENSQAKEQLRLDIFTQQQELSQKIAATHPVTNTTGADTPSIAQNISTSGARKKKIFIGYSHKDKRYWERLRTHLAGQSQQLDVWDDSRILPGEQWSQQIENALQQADTAILLISADFLASKFVTEVEFPKLLQAIKDNGTVILPVIVSPCAFELTPLSRFQAVNRPTEPLSALNRHQREKVWDSVVNLILQRYKGTE